MQEQQLRNIVQDFIEHEVASEPDLWPKIQEHQKANPNDSQQTQHRSTTHTHRGDKRAVLRHALVTSMALTFVALLLFISVPAIRAEVLLITNRFGFAFIDTQQVEDASTERALPTIETVPTMTIEQAQAQVDFVVRTPQWLPEPLQLTYVSASDDHMRVSFKYESIDTPDADQGPLLMIGMVSGPPVSKTLLAASREQEVFIQGYPAVYVKGNWRSDGLGDPNTALGDLRWDDELDSVWLSWQDDTLTYQLAGHGLDLDWDETRKIAESMYDQP